MKTKKRFFSIIALVISVGIFTAFVKGRVQQEKKSYPYTGRETLLTSGEQKLLSTLETAAGENTRVWGKMRLADILRTRRGLTQGTQKRALQKLAGKKLDFVLCDKESMKIQAVIMLKEPRPPQRTRGQRIDFLKEALNAAGIPLLRLPADRQLSPSELERHLKTFL